MNTITCIPLRFTAGIPEPKHSTALETNKLTGGQKE